jgi:hypothetical protein
VAGGGLLAVDCRRAALCVGRVGHRLPGRRHRPGHRPRRSELLRVGCARCARERWKTRGALDSAMEDLSDDNGHHRDGNPLTRRTSACTASSPANNGAAFPALCDDMAPPQPHEPSTLCKRNKFFADTDDKIAKSNAMVFNPQQDETGGTRMSLYGSTS